MNRTLKFRLWDKSENRWVAPGWNKDPHGLDYHQSEYYLDTNGIVREIGFYGEEMDEVQNVIIQQYTGCKDSNDKEIYEGDIVFYFDSNYVVEWSNSLYCWRGVHPDYHKGYNPKTFNQYRRYTIEEFNLLERFGKVIGNIMESPELLK